MTRQEKRQPFHQYRVKRLAACVCLGLSALLLALWGLKGTWWTPPTLAGGPKYANDVNVADVGAADAVPNGVWPIIRSANGILPTSADRVASLSLTKLGSADPAWVRGSLTGTLTVTSTGSAGEVATGDAPLADDVPLGYGTEPIIKTRLSRPVRVRDLLIGTSTVNSSDLDAVTVVAMDDVRSARRVMTVRPAEPLPGVCTADAEGAITCTAASPGSEATASVPPVMVRTLRGTSTNTANETGTESAPDAADSTSDKMSPQTTVTVDTTSTVVDGDVSSVSALYSDPGNDLKTSFLEALTAVNNTGPGHAINFHSSLSGTTIAHSYTLYLTASGTVIDGDVNGDGRPDVVLDGPDGYTSLEITSDDNMITSLAIAGLSLRGASARSNEIVHCYLGTDLAGKVARGEQTNGIQIVDGANYNFVENNIIAGNAGDGGVLITNGAHDNDISSNRIGVNVEGNALGNRIGIQVSEGSHNNTIGDSNVISGNSEIGIWIEGAGTKNNKVQGNYIGLNPDGTAAMPNGTSGVVVSLGASQNTIGGNRTSAECDGPCNVISGNGVYGVALAYTGTISNTVTGNFIGVNPTGTLAISNTLSGVVVSDGASQNTIGGARDSMSTECDGPCNVISGNGQGVWLLDSGTMSNTVRGNFIGVDPDGTTAMPNGLSGVMLQDGASHNTIGGQRDSAECDGSCNVISGNSQAGITLSSTGTTYNVVQGNYVGVNPDGTAAMPNDLSGVMLQYGASQNTIGGERTSTECTGPCNLISGNRQAGVGLLGTGTENNRVEGNYIGMAPNGTVAVPNLWGVGVTNGASSNVIGGRRASDECKGRCNLISGNDGAGVAIWGPGSNSNWVMGNYVGADKNGKAMGVGNGGGGVGIVDASGNNIGEVFPGGYEGNRIVANRYRGVVIVREGSDPTNNNSISRNEFYRNQGPAIDLVPVEGIGVAANGPNDGRSSPILEPTNDPHIYKGVVGAPDGSIVELYDQGGSRYLTSTIVSNYAFSVTVDSSVTMTTPVMATVTDPSGNTSEFSRQGSLVLSSRYALPGGRVYAFGTITENLTSQPITNATGVGLAVEGAQSAMRRDGQGADFYKYDVYYSGWITAPTTPGDYPVTISANGTGGAVAWLQVTDRPELVILTDLEELMYEFKQTAGRLDADFYSDFHEVIERIAEYSKDYHGVFVDLRQDIGRTDPIYTLLRYTAGYDDRKRMGVAIDNYIHSLERYKSTLRYLAIIGDDAVVPSFRRNDPTDIERRYPSSIGGHRGNPTLIDSGRGVILTDVPYASFDNTNPNNEKRPIPDLSVGRIFYATPAELEAAFDAYEQPLGFYAGSVGAWFNLRNDLGGRRVLSGSAIWFEEFFDFRIEPLVKKSYHQVILDQRGYIVNPVDGTFYRYNGLLTNWTRMIVLNTIVQAQARFVGLDSHATQFSIHAESGDALTATDLKNLLDQSSGQLILSTGCHSGYPVSRPPGVIADYFSRSFATTALGRHIAWLAPTTSGYGGNYIKYRDNVQYHDRLWEAFLKETLLGTAPTVGMAYKSAQVKYNSQRGWWSWDDKDTYIRYGTALYGLPTQCIANRCPEEAGGTLALDAPTPVKTSGAARLTASQTTHTLDVVVDTPNFQVVTNPDGTTRFELPNTGVLGGAAHYPILPEVLRSYRLPAGAAVTSVTVTDQTSSVYPSPVMLETVTPVNRTFGPQPGRVTLTETYPSEIYWHATTPMGASELLVVGVNPLQYDPATQQVTLYTHVELQVTYEAPESATTITGLLVNNGDPVDIGQESLPLRVTIDSHQAQTLRLDWEISDVAGSPLRVGQTDVSLTAGANTVDIDTDTLGWPPGPMLLTVSLGDGVTAIDTAETVFTARGRSLDATLDRSFYNTGVSAMVSVAVYDETGAGVSGLTATFTATLDSAPIPLAFSELEAGRYQATLSLTGLAEGGHSLAIGLAGSDDADTGFTIDHTPPTSTLEALPSATAGLVIPIHWSGWDDWSDVAHYEIQYRVGPGGEWTTWITPDAFLDYYPAHSTAFFGPSSPVEVEYGQTYYFRIRAVDVAGNVEAYSGGDAMTWTTTVHSPAVDRAEAIARVAELTNEQRALNGLPPLKIVDLLNNSAQGHSEDMAANDFMAHEGSNGSRPADRILLAGYEGVTTAENVAAGQATPEEVMDAWMNSPPHRANILLPDLREIGIGYAFNPLGEQKHYWTQNFGTRDGVYPVVINGEAELTSSQDVTLYIYGEGWATEMMVSNYEDFWGATWQPYQSTMAWALDGGQGERTVYVRLRDAEGTTLDASDDIILSCCVPRGADLSLTKTGAPDLVSVGETMTYTLVVGNSSPSDATGVFLIDTLPEGADFGSYYATQGFCSEAAGVVTCDLDSVGNSSSVTVTITVVPTGAAGTLINRAEVMANEGDPNTTNNTAAKTTTVNMADLSVSKSDWPDPVMAGFPLAYTITVINGGPMAATGVTLTDTLPAEVTFASVAASQGSCNGTSTVVCDLGSLADGATATVTVVVTPTAAGTITNTVSVRADEPDYNVANNAALAVTAVYAAIDLMVSKSASPDPVSVGETMTYTVVVSNNNPSEATGVILIDTLPVGVDFVSYDATQGFCRAAARAVTCALGDVDGGSSVTVTISAVPTAEVAGTITNTVRVTADEQDPDPANNTATATTTVNVADLSVSKSDSPDPVRPGLPVTYTITVRNDGPATATGVTLTDTLPSGVSSAPAVPSQGSCSGTSTVVCDLGSLTSGSTATVTIVITTNQSSMLENSVSVGMAATDVVDPNPGNNTAVERTTVAGHFFTVNSTGDGGDSNPGDGVCNDGTGQCTLRAAIEEANAQTDFDAIAFSIPGAGPHTIQPASPLPAITDPVIIDGTTEPDFAGTPVIELDGSNAGAETNGLTITAFMATVRGLVINRFDGSGILVGTYNQRDNVIEGNYIGTNVTGTTDLGNARYGVHIQGDYTLGNVIRDNLISGNDMDGVHLDGRSAMGNVVEGNYIGTDATGTAALGNSWAGVCIGDEEGLFFRGGGVEHVVSDNLISGNWYGILLACSGCLVEGNYIGTDATGTTALGNAYVGVYVGTDVGIYGGRDIVSNTIKSNVISGNGDGIFMFGGATHDVIGNKIQGNYIGTDANGTAALGNAGWGVHVQGEDNLIGGTAAGEGNVISGNGDTGITLGRFYSASGTLVQDNYIGTDATGTVALGNAGHGVEISGETDNLIGGTAAGARNVISGNGDDGVYIGGTWNRLEGNYIGTDVSGTANLGNTGYGVSIYVGAKNTIGGTASGAGNTIAFNGSAGVAMAGVGNAILSNSIFSNIDLGIDLEADGVTANDPADGDSGANNLQNFPLLALAAPGSTIIEGTLNSTGNTTFTLQFFSNSVCDPSGYGEGEDYLGSVEVTTDGDGDASFTIEFTTTVPLGHFVTATATDPDGNTSEFSPCTPVAHWADLAVVKTDIPDPVMVGQALTYTIVVTNNGPWPATGVTLIDTLPAGVSFASATASQGSCSGMSTITCILGSLDSGASATATIVVVPTAAGTIINTVGVIADESDPYPADNTIAQSTEVNPADLAIGKSDSPDPVTAGLPLTYTLTVTNNGPLDATGVRLADALPAGVTLDSATPSQGSCSGTSTIVCDLGTLADGATATVTDTIRF